ncbi:hypothetical protein BJ742DRAFT_803725 [Cladochytrium replicatum]|nr:hypothetical protein BJ742DRAFT_803725 [Cladochytrium replicatum]
MNVDPTIPDLPHGGVPTLLNQCTYLRASFMAINVTNLWPEDTTQCCSSTRTLYSDVTAWPWGMNPAYTPGVNVICNMRGWVPYVDEVSVMNVQGCVGPFLNVTGLPLLGTLNVQGCDMSTSAIPWTDLTIENPYIMNLWLKNDGLRGQIDDSIGTMKRAMDIDLVGNALTGPVPRSIGNLTNLISLHLEKNQLDGQIPTTIGNLVSLTSLRLDSNNFAPSPLFPMAAMSRLRECWLPGVSCRIPGQFVDVVCELTHDIKECDPSLLTNLGKDLPVPAKVGISFAAIGGFIFLLAMIVMCAIMYRRFKDHEGPTSLRLPSLGSAFGPGKRSPHTTLSVEEQIATEISSGADGQRQQHQVPSWHGTSRAPPPPAIQIQPIAKNYYQRTMSPTSSSSSLGSRTPTTAISSEENLVAAPGIAASGVAKWSLDQRMKFVRAREAMENSEGYRGVGEEHEDEEGVQVVKLEAVYPPPPTRG